MWRWMAALALVVGATVAQVAQAQQPALALDSTYATRLKDGSLVIGRLAAQSADTVQLVTTAGRLSVARANVRDMRLVHAGEMHDGEYWPRDSHDTRLFFGPTGRTLHEGEGYFSDYWLFFGNVAYGVTDRLMVGVGMSLFPSSSFFSDNIYYVMPKVALVQHERFNLSLGGLVGFAGRGTSGTAGMMYLAATNGLPDASLTYGVGWAYGGDKVHGDPALLLGGTRRISRRVALMSENYIFTGNAGGLVVPMYGVRLLGDRFTTDLGFLNAAGRGTTAVWPGVPWVGFALKF